MSDETNRVSDRASQATPPEGPASTELPQDRQADAVIEQNAGENSARARYMGTNERVRPERAPESLEEAVGHAPAEAAGDVQPAKPPAKEHDINPRETHGGPQPDEGEPTTHRIGNRSRP